MADRRVLSAPGRGDQSEKKLVAAVAGHVLDGGAYPDELLEIDLCERFGWTLSELDEQDEARVLPGVGAANLRNVLRRVTTFLETGGAARLTNSDLELYGWAIRMRAELATDQAEGEHG